jgi:large subunit ribosomal protein L14
MIQVVSKVKGIDNSGAKLSMVIRILGGNKRKPANLGSNLIVTVKKATTQSKIKKGQVCKFKLLRTNCTINRKDGTQLTFDKNGGIFLDNEFSPIGSRILGPLAREIETINTKISSMSKKIL